MIKIIEILFKATVCITILTPVIIGLGLVGVLLWDFRYFNLFLEVIDTVMSDKPDKDDRDRY